MSKTLSFKGIITPGTDAQKIKLSTLKGKTGYRIKNFQIIASDASVASYGYVVKIHNKPASVTAIVDFTDDALMAVAYIDSENDFFNGQTIIFDNEMTNQDIYVTGADAEGGVSPVNFYIELETMTLSDIQSTQLTLRNLRTIASR